MKWTRTPGWIGMRFGLLLIFCIALIIPLSESMASNQISQVSNMKPSFSIVPELKVIPGGQSIGVKVQSEGIMVVGHYRFSVMENGQSRDCSPAEDAHIAVGDVILRINGETVTSVQSLEKWLNHKNSRSDSWKVDAKRDDKTYTTTLIPRWDEQEQKHRLGVYIRDTTAGIGTLTFYAPQSGVYGALGHRITDGATQKPIPVTRGEILHSEVTSINKSKLGVPGEKRAKLSETGRVLGTVDKNTNFGLFGRMKQAPEHGWTNRSLPIGYADEIVKGPAQILTVIEGQKVEAFDIEIEQVRKQIKPQTKSMVIRIKDKRLLEETGGIVQGMSGSPIIQNGKIIGAVTHVFVQDPASGYGCFIEWMLQDAGVMQELHLGSLETFSSQGFL